MAEIEENRAIWQSGWDWSDAGESWSAWWGDSPAQWYGAILPRIHAFVPTGTILEIAPGYGRWTQYLKDLCERLVLVDLTERCIESCRERFAHSDHIEYHVNDGKTLNMVRDDSVDLAFSFDSLVHVELDVLEAYLRQLSTKLTTNGVGIFHHSNLGQYRRLTAFARRVPQPLLRKLIAQGVLPDLFAWRSERCTAPAFASLCRQAGLSCVSQELITWEHGRYLTDTVSVFTRPGSRWDRTNVVWKGREFQKEAARSARVYAASSYAVKQPLP